MRKILVLAISLLSTYSFADEQTPRFGVTLKYSDGKACATFRGNELNPGQAILYAAFDPPRWIKGKITKKRTERCETRDVVEGVAYEVQMEPNKDLFFNLGIAVVETEAKTAVQGGRPILLSSINAQPIVIHKCTSYEGLHLSAWQGQRRIWHEYYYLGYDVDPTCSKDEAEE